MSLNSIIMLIRVFNDIMILHMCLNNIIMSCENEGARRRRPLRPTRWIVLSGSVLQCVVVLSHTNTPPANPLQCGAVCYSLITYEFLSCLPPRNSRPDKPKYIHTHTHTHTYAHTTKVTVVTTPNTPDTVSKQS